MPVTVTMPQLGESVTEGTVTRWLKKVGDSVAADEPLLEVSTDKVDTEIPSPASGVLLEIRAGEDAVVLVGGDLGVIGAANESVAPTPAAPEPVAPAVPATPQPAPTPSAPPAASAPAAQPSSPPVQTPPQATAAGSTDVTLPQLGESVTEGTITRWLKQVGDSVAADEPLLEVSTDKVDTEIPSPVAGVLLEIRAGEDSVVPVGSVLAVVGAVGAAPAPPAPTSAPAPVVSAASAAPAAAAPAAPVAPVAPAAPVAQQAPSAPSSTPAAASAPSSSSSEEPYLTPLVRKLAADNGVDISTVVGTGIGGRIRKSDVLAAAAAKAAPSTPPTAATSAATPVPIAVSPLAGTTAAMSRLRRVIAERMVTSMQTSAQLTTVVEVDVTRVAALRAKHKGAFEAREGVKLTFLPFFAKAAIEALRQYPQLNASLDDASTQVTYHPHVDLGIAVDTERGLLVPVIRNSEELTIAAIARRIADLADRTRTGKVSPDDLSGGTFTITNTGSRGALFDTPIINLPQVAILGTGAIVKRPVVMSDDNGDDVIAVRSMVFLALSYDHRLIDGADAARFLGTVKQRLEDSAFEGEL